MDNWAKLEALLGEEDFNLVRHDEDRKLESFEDANATVTIPVRVAALLPHAILDDDPFGDLPTDCENSIFIAFVNSNKYLVNTEGFGYSRYIAKLAVEG